MNHKHTNCAESELQLILTSRFTEKKLLGPTTKRALKKSFVKSILPLLTVIGMSVLFTHQANAVTITIHEDTDTRLDFSLDWSSVSRGEVTAEGGQHSYIVVDDFTDELVVTVTRLFSSGALTGDNFSLRHNTSPAGGRGFQNLNGFDGSYTDFVPDSTGARFTYGSPPPTVPDGGSSLLLLGLAGAGLLGFQRKFS